MDRSTTASGENVRCDCPHRSTGPYFPNGAARMNQRWLYRQDRYRPAGETINTRLYDVAPIGTKQAKAFVQTHHYSGPNSWVYDRFRFGLFTAGRLVGCAVFSPPRQRKNLLILSRLRQTIR